MNLFSAVSWMSKALRGHSVTFAVLLGCAVLGLSILQWLRLGMGAIGVPWIGIMIGPTILLGVLAKKERVWIPEETRRKFLARGIVAAAVLLAVVNAWIRSQVQSPPDAQADPARENVENAAPTSQPLRPRGPSGK